VKKTIALFMMMSFPLLLCAQSVMRQSFHDSERKKIKETYYVKDTLRNILHGLYTSYYLNGNIESKGQFVNNETAGVWDFYYETGVLKMRGILFKGANYGLWEYFFESGKKSMEGIIYGRKKEGEWKVFYENGQVKEVGEYKENLRNGPWKFYFEDGQLRGEIDYQDDFGRYIEYDHAGKVTGEGPKMGTRQVGHWRYFGSNGVLISEGDFTEGKKHGVWVEYFSSGKVSARGNYQHDEPSGTWEYYFESGAVSAKGEYLGGQKNGYWRTFTDTGILMSEVNYKMGSGEYAEYHKSGKIKVKGSIVNDKKEGLWEFYYEGGQLEGKCDFKQGKGVFFGYYPNGTLQTKGTIDGNRKTGTWEIYDMDGQISGYYKPFYDQTRVGSEVIDYEGKTMIPKRQPHRFTYFTPRANEFRGVILGGNPVLMFAGLFPLGIEYYSQERLGHEFEFNGIRNPFFRRDENVPEGELFKRGYTIALKQKFYNPFRSGLWYFGHEIRFTNLGHFTNVSLQPAPTERVTVSAFEQRVEYGMLFGYRYLHRKKSHGLTIDFFGSVDMGYRDTDINTNYADYFKDVNQSRLVTSIHVGLNIGHMFSNR
jgi:uncharacterized protein